MNYFKSGKVTRYLRSHDGQTSWAMVTGASDGIGAGFAQELATHGFNLILHGRNPNKLGKVRDGILKDHPNVLIRTVIADASKVTPAMIDEIVQTIKMFPITVLINNVGGGSPLDANFQDLRDAHRHRNGGFDKPEYPLHAPSHPRPPPDVESKRADIAHEHRITGCYRTTFPVCLWRNERLHPWMDARTPS